LTSSTFTTLGGGVVRGFYDRQRHILFTSNLPLNEVDVVSTTDFSVVQRINVPAPVGIDQMPDGNTIVVGTETQGIYLINEDTYAVQSFFISTPSPIASVLLPIIPAAMANGKVLFIGLALGGSSMLYYLEGELYEWDPATNSFTAPSSSISSAVTVHLARSGDHKFAVFDQAGGGVFLYSSDTDSFNSINNGLFAGDVAGNANGSQFAVSINGAVNFYDRNLNLLSSVTLPTRSGSPVQEVAPFYGMQYSPDNSTVYIQATDQVLSPLVAIDAKQFAVTGMIPAYFTNRVDPAYLMASDNSQIVYVAASGGVGAVDCSKPVNSLVVDSFLPTLTPDSVALNSAASITVQAADLPKGTTVTIGSKSATLASNTAGQTTVTVPAFSTPGPADVVFSLPDGSTFVLPQALAYGTTASALNPSLAPDQVSVDLTLSGSGIAPQQQLPSVTVGGGSATVVPNSLVATPFISLQQIQFSTPPSGPAGSADVAVSNPNGASTLKSALTYVHTTVVPSNPGLSSLLYDSTRNLLYAIRTNGSQVFVFDPASLQWKSPLPIPGALTGANYNYFTMTSDGAKILAVDSNNAVLSIFSPGNPSAGQSISLHNASAPNAPPANQLPFMPATYVGVTNTGKVFVNMVGWYPAVVDLSNMSFAYENIGILPGDALFRSSLDGSHLIAGSQENSDGGISIWNPTTGTFQGQGYGAFLEDFAVTNDGKTSAAVAIDQSGTADFTYFIDDQLHLIGQPQYPDLALPQTRIVWGAQFNPQGTVFVIPRQNSIDFFDVATGHLRASYATPEPTVTPQNVADIKTDMTMDTEGKTLFLISASGLTVVQFAEPIDSLPRRVWPFYKGKAAAVVLRKAHKNSTMQSRKGSANSPVDFPGSHLHSN
jgi:hypothetical protein